MTGMRRPAHSFPDARCARVLRIVAARKGLCRADLLSATRSRSPVAHGRQLAMYLCHVLLGLNLTQVGRYFGRDRTTVAHACALIEDAREDVATDKDIEALEDAILQWIASSAQRTNAEASDAAR